LSPSGFFRPGGWFYNDPLFRSSCVPSSVPVDRILSTFLILWSRSGVEIGFDPRYPTPVFDRNCPLFVPPPFPPPRPVLSCILRSGGFRFLNCGFVSSTFHQNRTTFCLLSASTPLGPFFLFVGTCLPSLLPPPFAPSLTKVVGERLPNMSNERVFFFCCHISPIISFSLHWRVQSPPCLWIPWCLTLNELTPHNPSLVAKTFF